MKDIINIVITCTVLMLAVQLYVVDSKKIAQTDPKNSLLAQEDRDIETEEMIEDEKVRQDHERGESTFRDRVRQRRGGGTGTWEEKKPKDIKIEDVRTPDPGVDNLPAEPPVNEIRVETEL